MMSRTVTCPYCGEEMRFVTNLGANRVKAYFHCGKCFSRSPRVWVDYTEDLREIHHVPSEYDVQDSISAVEDKAHRAAMGIFCAIDDMSFDEDFEKLLEIDDL